MFPLTSVISVCSFLIPLICSVFTLLNFSLNLLSFVFLFLSSRFPALYSSNSLSPLPSSHVSSPVLTFFPLCSHLLLIFWFIFTVLLYDFLYFLASALSILYHSQQSWFLPLFATSDHDLLTDTQLFSVSNW